MRTDGAKGYYWPSRDALVVSVAASHGLAGLPAVQTVRGVLSEETLADLHGPVTDCLTVRARSPQKDLPSHGRRRCSSSKSVSEWTPRRYAARKPILGLDRRAKREREREMARKQRRPDVHVANDKSAKPRPRSCRVWEAKRIQRLIVGAAAAAAGTCQQQQRRAQSQSVSGRVR